MANENRLFIQEGEQLTLSLLERRLALPNHLRGDPRVLCDVVSDFVLRQNDGIIQSATQVVDQRHARQLLTDQCVNHFTVDPKKIRIVHVALNQSLVPWQPQHGSEFLVRVYRGHSPHLLTNGRYETWRDPTVTQRFRDIIGSTILDRHQEGRDGGMGLLRLRRRRVFSVRQLVNPLRVLAL